MAAVCTVRVGQCGNQLGEVLFDQLFDTIEESNARRGGGKVGVGKGRTSHLRRLLLGASSSSRLAIG